MENFIKTNSTRLMTVGTVLFVAGMIVAHLAAPAPGSALVMAWIVAFTGLIACAIAWVLADVVNGNLNLLMLIACCVLLVLTAGSLAGSLAATLAVGGGTLLGIALNASPRETVIVAAQLEQQLREAMVTATKEG